MDGMEEVTTNHNTIQPIIPHTNRRTTRLDEVNTMQTMMSLSAWVMLLALFLMQLPQMIALVKSTALTVGGWLSGLVAQVKGLFGSKS